jgi:tetratricopeptide (TPR) repeat protein
MIKKIKKFMLTDAKLAESYENNGEFDEAYKEYFKIGDYIKAGKILEKTGKWHEAANLYIQKNQIDQARRAVENCFKRDKSWEMYELDNGGIISIEDWLKRNRQIQRFARYVRYVEILNNQGVPLIVVLANKFKKVLEYKAAADLYKRGFDLINKRPGNKIQDELWLKNAAECYARAKLYPEASQCIKELIVTGVNTGDALPENDINPYENYIQYLALAKEWNFLPQLLEILEDFDPFNIAYDLLKIGEPELSINVFFKFFGKVIKKHYSDKEIEIRNKRIQYCFNQYIIYYKDRKEYRKAAEIALLDSQKETAAELFRKAEREKETFKTAPPLDLDVMKTTKEPREQQKKQEKIIPGKEVLTCPTCGEIIASYWKVCPHCNNTLNLEMCECGQKLNPHWKICPACRRELKQPAETHKQPAETQEADTGEDIPVSEDTRPFVMPKKFIVR